MITTPAHSELGACVCACVHARVGGAREARGFMHARTHTHGGLRITHCIPILGTLSSFSFTHAIASLAAGGYSQIEPGVGLS